MSINCLISTPKSTGQQWHREHGWRKGARTTWVVSYQVFGQGALSLDAQWKSPISGDVQQLPNSWSPWLWRTSVIQSTPDIHQQQNPQDSLSKKSYQLDRYTWEKIILHILWTLLFMTLKAMTNSLHGVWKQMSNYCSQNNRGISWKWQELDQLDNFEYATCVNTSSWNAESIKFDFLSLLLLY